MNDYQRYLDGIVGVVEATSFEKTCLWRDVVERKGGTWSSSNGGRMFTVGFVDQRPVCVSFIDATINGHKIMFIEATSQVVDWVMIDNWLKEHLPATALKNDGKHINKVDAGNFHNVFPREPVKRPIGMVSHIKNHAKSCVRAQGGSYCSCGFS